MIINALADSVPGVSGGTIAFLLGFYDSFINSLNDIMGRDNAKRKKAFFFLIKLGIGWVIGMLLAVSVLANVFESGIYKVSSLFLGFIILAIPVMIMEEKEALSTIEAVSQQANAIGHVVFSPDIAELNYVFPENIALPIQQKLSLTMLAAKDSIYAKRQKTLSLAGLLQHPLILYAPHGMENSHLYMILQQAGRPNIKYIVSNVQAFYALLNNGDCVALGLQNASIAPVENILAIPVRTKLNVYTYLLINKAIQDESAIRDFQDIYLRYVLS